MTENKKNLVVKQSEESDERLLLFAIAALTSFPLIVFTYVKIMQGEYGDEIYAAISGFLGRFF